MQQEFIKTKDMAEYILPKRHKPDDIITILVGPHKGEKITYREWRQRVAPIMRNIRRCMGAMFEGKSPSEVQFEEVQ